jgi:O-antigen/teichoic acid export membrane protein
LPEIRVTYTGLIAFVIALVTVFASMIFNLIITRTLTLDEYGTWGLINGFLTYAVVLEPIIGYWVAREIARKVESGKTAIISSGVFSSIGIVIFIIVSFLVGKEAEVDLTIIFLALVLIPPRFLNGILSAINQSWKPHTISYAIISLGITQIPMALIFIYYLDWGIPGLIFSVFIGLIVSNIILGWFAREKIKSEFNIEFLKKWIKLFWLPLYLAIPAMVYRLDVIIFTVITGSITGLAFWTAALAISTIVSHSGLIARAIYPKMLVGKGDGFLKSNFTQFFYFSIPLTALVITFARPMLFTLNPIYEEAYLILVFLSFQVFFTTLGGVIEITLLGKDEVDIDKKSKFRDYLKSRLFGMPTLEMIQHSVYITLLIIGLMILISSNSTIELIIYWSVLSMGVRIPFTIYRYRLLQKSVKLKFEVNSISKYLISSIVIFGGVFIITNEFLVYNERIFEFLPNLLFFVTLGICGYLIMTYLIDNQTKNLVHAIFKEIRKK